MGRYDLKLTDTEFWELSFKEFDLLRRRYDLQEYRRWEQTAGLMCMIYNVHRPRRARALKVNDLIQDPFKRKQSARDMAHFFKELTKQQGGRVDDN